MSRTLFLRFSASAAFALLSSTTLAAPPKFYAQDSATGAARRVKSLSELSQANKLRQRIFFTGDANQAARELDGIRTQDLSHLLSGLVTPDGGLKIWLEDPKAPSEPVAQIQMARGEDPEAAAVGSLARLEREMNRKAWSGSFFDIQRSLNKTEIDAQNERVLELMLNEPFAPIDTKGLLTGITRAQAEELQRTIQTSHASQISYKGRAFGMCFGRSIISHIEALRRGVHPDAVKKIWVVGKQQGWEYHVATAVRNIDGGWWVIDGFFGLNPVQEWLPKNLRDSDDGRMTFFVTDANRFGPYSPQKYTKVDLYGSGGEDFYNGFFKDYFDLNRKGELPARWNRAATEAPAQAEQE
jgi:hypothetical protein